MSAKRFLGLGFTFSAVDKGLEKKLRTISGLVKEINSGMKDVGSVGAKSMKMASGDFQPKAQRSSRLVTQGRFSARPGYQPSSEAARPSFEPKKPGPSKVFDASIFQKELNDTLTGLSGGLRKNIADQFAQTYASSLRANKDQRKAYMDAVNAASKVSGSMKTASLESTAIYHVFKYASNYISKTLSSFESFLDTLGINLRNLVPKELVAAFGVLKTLVSPLGDAVKGLFRKGTDAVISRFGKLQVSRLNENIKNQKRGLKYQQALQAAVTNNPSISLAEEIRKLAEATAKKDEDISLFDKLKMALAGIAGAILGGILRPLDTLKKGFALLRGVLGGVATAFGMVSRFLARVIATPIIGFLSQLAAYIGGAILQVVNLASQFLRVGAVTRILSLKFMAIAAVVLAVGATLFGFIETLWAGKDRIVAFFSELGRLIKNVASAIFADVAPFFAQMFAPLKPVIDLVVKGFNLVVSAISYVIQNFTAIIGDIFNFFRKTIGGTLAEGLLSAFDKGTTILKSWNDSLESTQQQGPSNRDYDLQAPIIQGAVEVEKDPAMGEVAENTSQQTQLMRQLVDLTKESARNNAPKIGSLPMARSRNSASAESRSASMTGNQ